MENNSKIRFDGRVNLQTVIATIFIFITIIGSGIGIGYKISAIEDKQSVYDNFQQTVRLDYVSRQELEYTVIERIDRLEMKLEERLTQLEEKLQLQLDRIEQKLED